MAAISFSDSMRMKPEAIVKACNDITRNRPAEYQATCQKAYPKAYWVCQAFDAGEVTAIGGVFQWELRCYLAHLQDTGVHRCERCHFTKLDNGCPLCVNCQHIELSK